MFIELLKIILPLLGGGLAGALFNEWRSRKINKVERIPLIERVNRLLNPKLEGITLARVVGDAANRELKEIENLREYQLTLRNTSSVHLQDAEIQFEFPVDDVEAWVSRPAVSKTSLVSVEPTPTGFGEPWKKAFRWRIPNLPSGDSVEFTFRAVDPASENYEAFLDKTGRIVIEKVQGEPAKADVSFSVSGVWGFVFVSLIAALLFGFPTYSLIHDFFFPDSGTKFNYIGESGCQLIVESSFQRYKSGDGTVWQIQNEILNNGTNDCTVQSERLGTKDPFVVHRSSSATWKKISAARPKSANDDISVAAAGAATKRVHFELYVEQ